jgi:hypothetical protein
MAFERRELPYEGKTAWSQAAVASLALFQRCSRFEEGSLQSALAKSENALMARK